MQPPKEIRNLCETFRRGLKAVLGQKLSGIYLYGAVAFPESGPTGDVDFHVILDGALTARERAEIEDLHAALARAHGGDLLDGYYILLEEARQVSPPADQLRAGLIDRSWALHREHLRAGRCIVLEGPDPKQVYAAASWPELATALQGELEYVRDHLDAHPDYCILNLCRLIYSFETRDVVISKAAAAAWAYDAFPEWRRHIEVAKQSYAGQATAEDREFILSEVGRLYRFARERIRKSRATEGPAAEGDR